MPLNTPGTHNDRRRRALARRTSRQLRQAEPVMPPADYGWENTWWGIAIMVVGILLFIVAVVVLGTALTTPAPTI